MSKARNVRMRSLVAIFAVSVLHGGCSLEKEYPAKDTFVIDAGPAPAAPSTRTDILRVESARIAPPYNGRSLIFRSGEAEMRPDYYNAFVADPDDLLTGELVRMLAESNAFATVLDPASTASATLRLECTVTDFYADMRNSTKKVAVCRARYRLLQEEPGRTVVAGDWLIEESSPIAEDSGSAAAAALGRAFGLTVNAFVQRGAK